MNKLPATGPYVERIVACVAAKSFAPEADYLAKILTDYGAAALDSAARTSTTCPASCASEGAGPVAIKPLPVFSAGPWLFEETGQRFTGKDLDEAAFVAYRDCIAVAPEGKVDDAMVERACAGASKAAETSFDQRHVIRGALEAALSTNKGQT